MILTLGNYGMLRRLFVASCLLLRTRRNEELLRKWVFFVSKNTERRDKERGDCVYLDQEKRVVDKETGC